MAHFSHGLQHAPQRSPVALPVMIRAVLSWIALHMTRRRMVSCRELWPVDVGERFRIDAKAEGDLVVLGGWSLLNGPSTATAKWFCIQLSPAEPPLGFRAGAFQIH